jgi:hypothetical protein
VTEQTKHADTEHATTAKKKLADEKQAREKAQAEQREAQGATKPTPTQEENDLAAMGVHVLEHEPDGSPDPNEAQTKQAEAGKRGNYQTRTANPST